MSLPDIIEKIKKDAEKEAEKILKDAEKEAEKIAKETEKEKEKAKQDFEVDVKKELSKKESSFMGRKRQELNTVLENEKRRVIDDAFKEAAQQLGKMSQDDYVNFVLQKVSDSIKDAEVQKVVFPEGREGETKNILEKLGIQAETEASSDFAGGLKIIGQDFEYNFTFEKMLADSKGDLEIKVSNILFAESETKVKQ